MPQVFPTQLALDHPARLCRVPVRAMPQGRALEHAANRAGCGPVAGVDEAGRGACCGPVTIAACILPDSPLPQLDQLKDSKQLSPARREQLFDLIRHVAIDYSVVHISACVIDARGIQMANVDGMRRAVARLRTVPGFVLTDALAVPGLCQPHVPVLKGDQVARCISAASVLAKVARDRVMCQLDSQFPGYGLASHKGYGTPGHMRAVRLLGGTRHHRYTYKNVAVACAEFEARRV